MEDQLKAALLIPPEAERWVHACTALAQLNGHRVLSLVHHWDDLWELLCQGLIDVGIVGEHKHLPPDRLPRIEIVDEYRPPPIPGPRRPHRLWRPGPEGMPPLT